MTDQNSSLPTPPWWSSREGRKAARDERRKSRHDARGERKAAKDGAAPRDPITPERLAGAALKIVDEGGLEGLTVRSLAQELGVGTMTIYWYVQNKDEILDLVSDWLLADVVLPPMDDDWRVTARQTAAAVRGAMIRHARALPVMVGRGSFGPNGLRVIDHSIAVFRRAGFDDQESADGYFAFSNYITGFALMQTANINVAGRTDTDRRAYFAMVGQYVMSLPPDQYPNLHATASRILTANIEERFNFGLECLISGLESRLEARKAAQRPVETQNVAG
jgi:TetR/AcrR family transcriptional regulator, tetracycline repressor protein